MVLPSYLIVQSDGSTYHTVMPTDDEWYSYDSACSTVKELVADDPTKKYAVYVLRTSNKVVAPTVNIVTRATISAQKSK